MNEKLVEEIVSGGDCFYEKQKDWHYCHECQLKRGAVAPEDDSAITVTYGICSMCKQKKTLVPNDDYHWPKDKRVRVWD